LLENDIVLQIPGSSALELGDSLQRTSFQRRRVPNDRRGRYAHSPVLYS